MKVLATIGRIIWHTIVLLVIVGILLVPSDPVQALIVGLLVMTIIFQAHAMRMEAVARIGQELRSYTRFLELRTAIGEPSTADELDAKNQLQEAQTPAGFWIHSVFASLASLAAIGRIIWVALG